MKEAITVSCVLYVSTWDIACIRFWETFIILLYYQIIYQLIIWFVCTVLCFYHQHMKMNIQMLLLLMKISWLFTNYKRVLYTLINLNDLKYLAHSWDALLFLHSVYSNIIHVWSTILSIWRCRKIVQTCTMKYYLVDCFILKEYRQLTIT